MAQSNKVVVWNAAQQALKVGVTRLILKPGQKAEVENDSSISSLVTQGKLVVVPTATSAPAEEPVKKKKKEVTETSVEVTEEEISSTENAEDSILPKEVE